MVGSIAPHKQYINNTIENDQTSTSMHLQTNNPQKLKFILINYQRRDPTIPLDVLNYLQNKQQQATIKSLRNPVRENHDTSNAPAPKTWSPLPVPKCPN